MKRGYGGLIRRDLGRLLDGESVAGLGEAQLLDRFVERRDPTAFEALVARHGPMVLGVCRRLLADPLDVEDAFQATFLVLIRRAGSIRSRDRLAPWLFGVARKVASRTRVDVARRQRRESSGVETIAGAGDVPDRELNQAILDEIDRLPAALREPVLLCCVEGLSYEAAASRMESTAPAVRGRLARGREQLRERLARRGFAPSVAGLTGWMGEGARSLVIPSKLLLMTTQLSRTGMFPARLEILAEGVIQTMIVTQTKFLAAAALLACGIAGTGVGVYAQKQGPGPSESRTAFVPPSADLVVQTSDDALPLSLAATEENPDDDRLGQLEKKLDRVLEALEGSNRPLARQTRSRGLTQLDPLAAPTAPTAPAVLAAPAPAAPAPVPVAPTAPAAPAAPAISEDDLVPSAPPIPPIPPARARQFRSTTSMSATTPAEPSRIDALEQAIVRLEARIVRLEQQGRSDRGSNPRPAAPRGVDPDQESVHELRPLPPPLPAPSPRP